MQELKIDTGVEEFRVNGRGVLRFNPADPNLYHRFFCGGQNAAAVRCRADGGNGKERRRAGGACPAARV